MKTILVTGCSRRFGLSLLQHYLEKGDKAVGISRSSNTELDALKARFGDHFKLIEVSDYTAKSALSAVAELDALNTSFDLLVNNASSYENDETALEDIGASFQTFFEVHMLFPTIICEWFGRNTEASHSVSTTSKNIINITDIFAENPSVSSSHYCSTKAALENLTKSFAKKFAPAIRVNSIQPGPVKFLPSHSEAAIKQVLSQTLIPLEGGFDAMIKTVEFIIDNHYITGSAIKVDGGRALNRG